MFTAKITANHIPKYKRPTSFLSFLMDLFSRFVKKYWKQECKKSAVRGGFSRLLDARSVIFSDFGGPGALFGEPGPQSEDFWDYCDFGGRSGAKGDSNLNKFSTFRSVIFWCCFECLLFRFFVILGARRLHSGINIEAIFRVPDLWKNI